MRVPDPLCACATTFFPFRMKGKETTVHQYVKLISSTKVQPRTSLYSGGTAQPHINGERMKDRFRSVKNIHICDENYSKSRYCSSA